MFADVYIGTTSGVLIMILIKKRMIIVMNFQKVMLLQSSVCSSLFIMDLFTRMLLCAVLCSCGLLADAVQWSISEQN